MAWASSTPSSLAKHESGPGVGRDPSQHPAHAHRRQPLKQVPAHPMRQAVYCLLVNGTLLRPPPGQATHEAVSVELSSRVVLIR